MLQSFGNLQWYGGGGARGLGKLWENNQRRRGKNITAADYFPETAVLIFPFKC